MIGIKEIKGLLHDICLIIYPLLPLALIIGIKTDFIVQSISVIGGIALYILDICIGLLITHIRMKHLEKQGKLLL